MNNRRNNHRPIHNAAALAAAATLAALAGTAATGCSSGDSTEADAAERPVQTHSVYDGRRRPVTERIGGEAARGPTRRGELVDFTSFDVDDELPARVGLEVLENLPAGDTRRVRLALSQATPAEVIRLLVGETLGRPYLLDAKLAGAQGSISLIINDEMSDRDIFDLVMVLAEVHGWSIETRDETLVFGEMARVPGMSSIPLLRERTALESAESAMRIFRPKHINASEAFKVCEPLMSEGSEAVVAGNILLVADRISQINRIGDVLAAIDTPAFQGVEVWTFRLHNADPRAVSQALDQVIQSAGFGTVGGAPAIATVPVQDLNYLMVVSRDPTAREAVGSWVQMLDAPPAADTRRRFVYRAQTARAELLERTLRDVFAEELSDETTAEDGLPMRISVDVESDTLIFHAQPRVYADVLAVLERIDGMRQQVLLTATIASVSLTDDLEFGIEAFITDTLDGSIVDGFFNPANAFGPTNPIGTAAITGASGIAILRALQEYTDVRVLSRPRIFVRDRDKGSFRVGGEVPILRASLDSQTQTDGSTGIRNEIEYRETGVFVEVQPRINERGEVVLLINQEITDVIANTTSGIDSPEFTTRVLETTVILKHGQTALLAGFMEQRTTDQKSGLPIVTDIPIVGDIFSVNSESNARTELVLSITPTIVNDPSEASEVYAQMLDHASYLRDALADFTEGQLESPTLIDDVGTPVTNTAPAPVPAPAPALAPPPATGTDADDTPSNIDVPPDGL